MNEEKVNGLLQYLKDLGYWNEELEQQILNAAASQRPWFIGRHEARVRDSRMVFDLKFSYDHQFQAYRLEEIRVIYQPPLEVGEVKVGPYNLKEIDQQMSQENWDIFFRDLQANISNPEFSSAARIYHIFQEIGSPHPDKLVSETLAVLMYKHWPGQACKHPLSELLKNTFDVRETLRPGTKDFPNIHLAYYQVSRKSQELYVDVLLAGFEDLPGVVLRAEIEKHLSKDPDSFILKGFSQLLDGIAYYTIPVIRKGDSYGFDQYTLGFVPYPEIPLRRINGVKPLQVESRISGLIGFDNHQSRPWHSTYIRDITEKMSLLSATEEGRHVASLLQLKYYHRSEALYGLRDQDLTETIVKLEQTALTRQFDTSWNVVVASNLMAGRAVHISKLPQEVLSKQKEKPEWGMLDLQWQAKEDFPVSAIYGFRDDELERQLNLLPLRSEDFLSAKEGLQEGSIIRAELRHGNRPLLISSDPRYSTLTAFSTDGRPVPFNFKLSNHYTPGLHTTMKLRDPWSIMPPVTQKKSGRKI